MHRGTTPTLLIRVAGFELQNAKNIYITLKQKSTIITKTVEDGLLVSGNEIQIHLTQSDTLQFEPGEISVQMRATTKDGEAIASDIKRFIIRQILKDGEIT